MTIEQHAAFIRNVLDASQCEKRPKSVYMERDKISARYSGLKLSGLSFKSSENQAKDEWLTYYLKNVFLKDAEISNVQT